MAGTGETGKTRQSGSGYANSFAMIEPGGPPTAGVGGLCLEALQNECSFGAVIILGERAYSQAAFGLGFQPRSPSGTRPRHV